MCRLDPSLRLQANGNGETDAVVYVSSLSKGREVLSGYNAVIVSAFPFINAFGVKLNIGRINDIASSGVISAVSSANSVSVSMDKSRSACGVELVHSELGYGSGVGVAVIDTGVNTHLDFMMPTQRLNFIDFTSNRVDAYDDNGHGTAVASILCGNGLVSGGKYKGIAPLSNLYSLKAISSKGEGSAFSILEAMQWLYDNAYKYNIKVACMSFGANPVVSGLDPLCLGAEELWKKGIVVVSSAGNDGPSCNTIKSPGKSASIITVGGAEVDGDKINVAEFSSRGDANKGDKPDIIAPSTDIMCCDIKNMYSHFTGTSMSAPIVAGLVAVLLSAYPNLTPNKVKELLIKGAKKVDAKKNEAGYGFVNIDTNLI